MKFLQFSDQWENHVTTINANSIVSFSEEYEWWDDKSGIVIITFNTINNDKVIIKSTCKVITDDCGNELLHSDLLNKIHDALETDENLEQVVYIRVIRDNRLNSEGTKQ